MAMEKKKGILAALFGAKKQGCCGLEPAQVSGEQVQAPANEKQDAQPSCCCGPTSANEAQSATFEIVGLGCACAGQIVEKRVKALKGVKTFSFSPITNRLKLTYDSSTLSIQEVQAAVRKAGATAVPVTSR